MSIAQVIAQQGWSLCAGESVCDEGLAQRARVELEAGGRRGLLYVWPHAQRAAWQRAQVVAGQAWAGQLFAVPDAIWSDEATCALLVEDVAGVTLARWLAARQRSLAETSDASLTLLEQLGVMFRKLHSLSAPEQCFGPVSGDWVKTFSGYVAATLERAQQELVERVELEDEHQRLSEWIGDLRYELSSFYPRHPASLNHGRPGLGSIWVDEAGAEIVGLTGFDEAVFLPPEADIASLLWLGLQAELDEQSVRAFYKGYGAARTMDVQRRERFYRRYAAIQALCHREQSPQERARLLRLASPSVL